jgi:hypothetical protein
MSRTALALTIAVLLAGPSALAGDPPAGPKPGDAAKPEGGTPADQAAKAIEEIKAAQPKQDETAAKASITKLLEYWRDGLLAAEVKKPIPDLIHNYAKMTDKAPISIAGLDALGELGPDVGAKPVRDILAKALEAKEPSAEIYGACFRNLKKLADQSKATTGMLVDLLKRKENDVISRAADTLAGYKNAKGAVRKDLMEEVLKIGESAAAQAKDGKNTAAVNKWNTIKGGVMAALNALSWQNFVDPNEARSWFNDHKKDAKIWG